MQTRISRKFVLVKLAERGEVLRDVAGRSAIGEATLYRIINGAKFSSETLGKLALALDCHPADLIEWGEADKDEKISVSYSKNRMSVFERDSYTCQYCGATNVPLECDHVVPRSKGGTHDMSNMVTACASCNRSKKNKLVSEWQGAWNRV